MATSEGMLKLIGYCIGVSPERELVGKGFNKETRYSELENIQYGRYISGLRSQIILHLKYFNIDVDNDPNFSIHPQSDLCNLVVEFAGRAYELALRNVGLIKIPLKSFNNGVYTEQDLDDLYQQGWEGLVKAALVYDPDYQKNTFMEPAKFSNLAIKYMTGAMRNYQANLESVRYPRRVALEINEYKKSESLLIQWFGEQVSDRETIAYMHLKRKMQRDPSEKEFLNYMEKINTGSRRDNSRYDKFRKRITQARGVHRMARFSDLRIVTRRDDNGDLEQFESELGDMINASADVDVAEIVDLQLLKELMNGLLSILTDREREILEMRYGLVNGSEHTLEEIGVRFKLTKERVRQIEDKAFRKLRYPTAIIQQLMDYLD